MLSKVNIIKSKIGEKYDTSLTGQLANGDWDRGLHAVSGGEKGVKDAGWQLSWIFILLHLLNKTNRIVCTSTYAVNKPSLNF
jgi:hypothetical protein